MRFGLDLLLLIVYFVNLTDAWGWQECAWVCPSVVNNENFYSLPNPGSFNNMRAFCCQAASGSWQVDLELTTIERMDVAFFVLSADGAPFQIEGTYPDLNLIGWMGDDTRCCLPRQQQWGGRAYNNIPVRADETHDWWFGAGSMPVSVYFSFVLGGGTSRCTANLTWTSPQYNVCGDRFRDEMEGCDDGNTMSGDGCSSECTIEAGSLCELSSSGYQMHGDYSTNPSLHKWFGLGDVCFTECVAGMYLDTSFPTSCQTCSPGEYSPAGAYMCTECVSGTFSEGSSSTCTLCPPGTYSSTAGATSVLACTLCEPGKFTMAEGTTSCWECARFNMTVPVNAHFASECEWSCDDGFEEIYLTLSEEEDGKPISNSTAQLSTVDRVFRLPVTGWAALYYTDLMCADVDRWVCDFPEMNGMASPFDVMPLDICCECSSRDLRRNTDEFVLRYYGQYFSRTNLSVTPGRQSLCNVSTTNPRVKCQKRHQRRTIRQMIDPEMQNCSLSGSWKEITRDKVRYSTGGLGKLINDEYEVWVCDVSDSCVRGRNDMMCYIFNEVTKEFIPLALNSEVKFSNRPRR